MLAFFVFFWISGVIFNIALWSMALYNIDEYTLGDVLISVGCLLLPWGGWICLMLTSLYEHLDTIVIYRRK